MGGGAAGVSTFIAAVRRCAAKTIYVIDPRPIGPGFAFANTDDDILCNTSVDIMSVVAGNHWDFLHFLNAKGYAATLDSYVPRRWAAAYFRERFNQYCAVANQRGIDVICLPYRFRSLRIEGYRCYTLRFCEAAAHASLDVSDVIFCTGFGAPRVPDELKRYRSLPTFIECPYPEAEMLAKVSPRSKVLVIGSKLSATDSAILLCRERHRVTMASPSGELLSVRSRFIRDRRFVLDLGRLGNVMSRCSRETSGPLTPAQHRIYLRYIADTLSRYSTVPWRTQFSCAERCDDRLREEIAIAEQGRNTWQDIIVSFVDAINATYTKYAQTFTDLHPEFRRTIFRYLTSIALPNARKLLQLIDKGSVSIKRGMPITVAPGDELGQPWLVDWGEGPETFDAIISAAGFHLPHFTFDGDGEIKLDIDGQCGPETLGVSSDLAAEHPRLMGKESIWFVGPPAHSRVPIPNALSVVAPSADRVVSNLVALIDSETMQVTMCR